MKRLVSAVAVILSLGCLCFAQTSADDSPASKADVERYFQVVTAHDMMKKLMGSMAQNLQRMTHDQYVKHQDELPSGYEAKMNETMDEMLNNAPWDEMMEAMVPSYQKHFTKGDMDNLVAFYSSPTGEKILREMPAILAESMQEAMPVMTKYMETVRQTLLKRTDEMIAQSKKPSNIKTPATSN